MGTEQFRYLIYFALALVVLVATMVLQRQAWVLIVLGWAISGYTVVLPLPLSGRDICVALAVVAYFVNRILAPSIPHYDWSWPEALLALNLVYLLFTLFIHPVGLLVFGSDSIGAHPYVNVAMACVAYWVLTRFPESPKLVSLIPLFILVSSFLISSLFMLSFLFPSVASHLPWLYALLDVDAWYASAATSAEIVRAPHLGEFGLTLAMVLASYYTVSKLLNPFSWRFWLLGLAVCCVLLSGFRNFMLWVFVALFLSCWFWGRIREMVKVAALRGLLLALVIAGQGRLYQLPLSAQRALAFLPGQWDEMVVADVQGSNEGRFAWWKDIVNNNLIKNWWVGDGFGAKATDLASASSHGSYHDFILLTGAYHSGPLSAIHYVGVIGRIFFYMLMIGEAVYAYACLQRCRGTILFPAAVFVANPGDLDAVSLHFLSLAATIRRSPRRSFSSALLRLIMRMAERLERKRPRNPRRPSSHDQ